LNIEGEPRKIKNGKKEFDLEARFLLSLTPPPHRPAIGPILLTALLPAKKGDQHQTGPQSDSHPAVPQAVAAAIRITLAIFLPWA
jgi:hypothetical protein